MIARRHIPPNTEIFVNYGDEYWEKRKGVYGTLVRKGVPLVDRFSSVEQMEALDKDVGILP